MAASSDTTLDVFSGLGAGLGAGLGFGVFAALLGYSLFPNMMLPTRTLVAPTSIFDRWENTHVSMETDTWDVNCLHQAAQELCDTEYDGHV